jgi:AcrR family transcriptional regulator
MTVERLAIRDQIVSSARNIFNRYGFKKATMDEIARAMGKGKSSIYYYFKSKEEIYEAVVNYEAGILKNEILKSVSQADNPVDKLRNYVFTRMKALKKVSIYYEAMASHVLSHYELINQMREKYDREEIRILKEILEEGHKQDVFRVEEPELTSFAIVTALKGLEIPMFWSNKRKDAEINLDRLLNVLFFGIIKH